MHSCGITSSEFDHNSVSRERLPPKPGECRTLRFLKGAGFDVPSQEARGVIPSVNELLLFLYRLRSFTRASSRLTRCRGWRTPSHHRGRPTLRGTGVNHARSKLAGCRIFSAVHAEKVRVLTLRPKILCGSRLLALSLGRVPAT
jgi:hypothetical protein